LARCDLSDDQAGDGGGANGQFVAQDSMIILPGQTAIDPVIDDLQAGLA
jgi:hypothetical protein